MMSSLFVNQLTTLDFSYLCQKRGLVGETWIADVRLSGDLDEQGMVFDFGHVKKQVKASLDFLADHRLLVPVTSTATTITRNNDSLNIQFQSDKGDIICQSPSQAALLVEDDEITISKLKPWLENTLLRELPDNVRSVELDLYPEHIDGAYYHYSHGLKKHLGDCQRIAHGHRSGIEVYVDNQRDSELEFYWADHWRDIYIATREDLLNTLVRDNVEYHQFGYTSDQGRFDLTIPAACCHLIETDTTVELLAEHIAQSLRLLRPSQTVKVVAFEGFKKGAIAEISA